MGGRGGLDQLWFPGPIVVFITPFINIILILYVCVLYVNAYAGVDYCARGGRDSCHPNATCINLKTTHKCACAVGYAGTGLQCDGN